MSNGLLINASGVVTCAGNLPQSDAGVVADAALAWTDGRIEWIGPVSQLPQQFAGYPRIDAEGLLVVPGLVDCHTHLAFGGWRADEFAERARGVSYLEIARRGGGIMCTVRQTREATEEELLEHARTYMNRMLSVGVTTIECKSGYGLTVDDELKLLRVYDSLRKSGPARIVATCLGAHVVPVEYRDDRSAYVEILRDDLIPRVADAGLAAYFDVFVEEGAFTADEARSILETASRFGLRAKLHVDQLHDMNGGALAAELDAVSADHLEYVSDPGIAAMEAAGVVPVALPLASLYLRQTPLNARRFLDREISVAVATEFNPGSAPSYHLPLAMTLACTMNGMTPAEALVGATRIAARAIEMDRLVGSLEPEKRADFILVDTPTVDQWVYLFEPNKVKATYIDGNQVWSTSSGDS
ncbi:MAG: imidazolonepropionase [Bacteroidetes bacterium]|nr:imidazolonepropionase [Bacteroidota bacterium]